MTTKSAGRGVCARLLIWSVLAVLVVPLLLVIGSSSATAAQTSPGLMAQTSQISDSSVVAEDPDADYSLYKLSSNAAVYFSNENSPDSDDDGVDRMGGLVGGPWTPVTKSAASAGSMLGYADPEFGLNLKWLTSNLSGSSQTIGYNTLTARDDAGNPMDSYSGMLDYAHFGSTNAALGLDTTVSGANMSGMFNTLTGTAIWVLYAVAMSIDMLFGLIIGLLKVLNPFRWFYDAIYAISPAFANGMTGGQDAPAPLGGLASFISQWYGLIVDISWTVMVPLFIATAVFSALILKQANKGSLLKKVVVRVIFIGVGLPLLGSLYTGALNKFDDSGMGTSAGPTKVVLSTYVDFEQWMMNDRLKVPADATIEWDMHRNQPSSKSMMSARTSALAINLQSNSDYASLHTGTSLGGGRDITDSDISPWTAEDMGDDTGNVSPVRSTFAMLGRYISGETVKASDFESGIKSTVTQMTTDNKEKKGWFVSDAYKDTEDFGEGTSGSPEGGPVPSMHPIISSGGGLKVSASSDGVKAFTSDAIADCRFQVVGSGTTPKKCNLSPLAGYNYLNSSFSSDSMTAYSSEKATSGFTRETHASVSRVGTGPAGFMYFLNAGTLLASMVLLGIWYGIGMLVTSVKRTIGVVAAIPFATLGAIAAISKVIIYSAALILEVLLTLFMYQFACELLLSIPQIIAGPVTMLANDPGSMLGNSQLGSVTIVVLIFFSTFIIIGVTFALLKARSMVLKAVDEAVTKLVNKFLETGVPAPSGAGATPAGGKGAALAAGLGQGVGAAAGSRMNAGGGGGSRSTIGAAAGNPGSTGTGNASGTNGGNPGPKNGGPGASGLATGAVGGGPALLGLGGADQASSDSSGIDNSGHSVVSSNVVEGNAVDDNVVEGDVVNDHDAADSVTDGQVDQIGQNADGSAVTGGQLDGGAAARHVEDGHEGVDAANPSTPDAQGVGTQGVDGNGYPEITGDSVVETGHAGESVDGQGQVGGDLDAASGRPGAAHDTGHAGESNDGQPRTNESVSAAPTLSDKEAAEQLQRQGGLTDYGYGDAAGPNAAGTASGRAVDLNGGTAHAGGTNPADGNRDAGAAVVAGQSAGGHTAAKRNAATEHNAVTEPGATRAAGTSNPTQGSTHGSTPTAAAGPRPLNQVPFTGRSNHVQRRPGESTNQHLKAKASAEGWRQTPAGWVPPASTSTTGTGAQDAHMSVAGSGAPRASAQARPAATVSPRATQDAQPKQQQPKRPVSKVNPVTSAPQQPKQQQPKQQQPKQQQPKQQQPKQQQPKQQQPKQQPPKQQQPKRPIERRGHTGAATDQARPRQDRQRDPRNPFEADKQKRDKREQQKRSARKPGARRPQ